MKAIRITEKILNKAIDVFLTAVFVLFLLIGAYVMYDMLYIYSGASQRGALVYKPGGKEAAEEVLKELSDDCVGWLTVDGSGIDYPVMQGRTNAEYLNTDPFGEYSLSGSIFLDCASAGDFSDRYSCLYGHHMEGGAMFGALDRYLNESYFREFRSGTLTLTDGTEYRLIIFAVIPCNAHDTEIFDVNEGGPDDGFIRSHALYETEHGDGRILAMTTCSGVNSDDRLAVLAEILEEK